VAGSACTVYYRGDAWTDKHDAWLRGQRFANPVTQAAFDSNYDPAVSNPRISA
jgi:hypothetical protein